MSSYMEQFPSRAMVDLMDGQYVLPFIAIGAFLLVSFTCLLIFLVARACIAKHCRSVWSAIAIAIGCCQWLLLCIWPLGPLGGAMVFGDALLLVSLIIGFYVGTKGFLCTRVKPRSHLGVLGQHDSMGEGMRD